MGDSVSRPARLVAVLLVVSAAFGASASVTFDDSAAGAMSLENDHYRFVFSKSNGAILSVVDRASGLEVSPGSLNGCLWGVSTPPSTYTGGCSPGQAFAYTWSAEARELSMTWRPASGSGLEARVVVTASDESLLDMRLALSGSHPERLDYVLFPSEVLFREAGVRQVLLPILPGITLERGFFAENRSYTAKYPGEGMFADFFALDSDSGRFAIYVLRDEGVRPSILGVVHDSESQEDRAYYSHAFAVRLQPGREWSSPVVRWRVGASFMEAARAFRRDSGIEALPSLERRLGSLFPRIVRAPFLKIDMEVMRQPFADYERLLDELPVPSVLHWVGFGARGFDEDYPDFLPPHPEHGTTEEFAALFRKARAMGHLNMPYTNPTWWDDESPTMRSLPAGLAVPDIAVLDDDGRARYETFGPRGGYAMSPWHPFVRQRADESVVEMTRDVPSDLLFQDQIGARPWIFDGNPSSPSPSAFIDGWIAHVARHPGVLLGTEQGFDALLPHEVAFFGSVPGEDDSWSDERFGPGNWAPWPFVPVVARDKVLLYPHNMGANPAVEATFRLNVAFGQMMMHTLHNPAATIFDAGPGGGLDSDALRTVVALQRDVIARIGTEPIEAFDRIAPKVTRTRFRTMEVVVNHDLNSQFEHDGHIILPGGFLVRSDDRRLTAGVVDRWASVPLTPGRHLVVETRGEAGLVIRKPSGGATQIVVNPLPSWSESTPIEARAVDVRGKVIRTVPSTRTPYGILFFYSNAIDDRLVDHYEIIDPTRSPRTRGARR